MTVPPSRADLPLWARPPVFALLIVLLTLPRLVFGARMSLIGDEAYYAVWSLHPSFGYYDHPPVVAWFIALGRMLFGEGPFAVRSLFLFSTFLVCAVLYRLGLLLFRDARIGAIAGIFYAVSVAAIVAFSVATPDGPSTLFWLLSLWAIAEFTARRDANWWLLAGLFAGFGLLSKYTDLFLGAGLLLYLLTSAERRAWFRLWQVWAGALLALLVFMPVVWWQALHDWNSFRFQFGRSSLVDGKHFTSLWPLVDYINAAIAFLLPSSFVFALIATWSYFFGAKTRPHGLALPILTAAPMVAFFFVHALTETANANWLSPLYPPLTLAAAWAVVSIRPRRRLLAWPLAVLRWLQVPLGLVIVGLAANMVETGRLPFFQPLRIVQDIRSWNRVPAQVAALARETGARWVETSSYSQEGWIGYGMVMLNDPLPVLQLNQPYRYLYAPPDPALLKEPHLVLLNTQPDAELPQPSGPHANVRFIERLPRIEDGHEIGAYAVYLVSD